MRPRALVFTTALILSSCANPANPGQSEDLNLQRLNANSESFEYNSGFDVAERRVIRSAAEWANVWAQIYKNAGSKPALPEIDFSREQVILAASGNRPSGGFAIRLTGASRNADGIVIGTETQSPGKGCTVLTVVTRPIDVARMPRTSGFVGFEETAIVRNCR